MNCDPELPNAVGKMGNYSPIDHMYKHIDEEYGSLSSGGSYDVYKCINCGRISYSQMAD